MYFIGFALVDEFHFVGYLLGGSEPAFKVPARRRYVLHLSVCDKFRQGFDACV